MNNPTKPNRWRRLLLVGTAMGLSAPLFLACSKDSSPDAKESTASGEVQANTTVAANANTKKVILNVFGMT